MCALCRDTYVLQMQLIMPTTIHAYKYYYVVVLS